MKSGYSNPIRVVRDASRYIGVHPRITCTFLVFLVGFVAYSIANLVAGVIAIILGAHTYRKAQCTYESGIYLIAHGSFSTVLFTVAYVVFNGLAVAPRLTTGCMERLFRYILWPYCLLALVQFGWAWYGMNLAIASKEIRACGDTQYAWFQALVFIAFYGFLAFVLFFAAIISVLQHSLRVINKKPNITDMSSDSARKLVII